VREREGLVGGSAGSQIEGKVRERQRVGHRNKETELTIKIPSKAG
jgi:hypothetical protein